MALAPVLSSERPNIVGGIWISKLIGEFEEGHPRANALITGKIEIKSHNDNVRLFMTNVMISKRKSVTEEITTFIPNLYLFISKKSPKTRMTDIHRVGYKVLLRNREEGMFNTANGNVEVSLKDIPDILTCQGIVVLKLPEDSPVTEEPLIFAMVKLQSSQLMTIKAISFLQIKDTSETITTLSNRNRLNNEALTIDLVKTSIKSLSYYRKLAKRVWTAYEKELDTEISYQVFLQFVDYIDIFVLEAQAQRYFQAMDVKKLGTLGISEFENFLISYDILNDYTNDILLLDIFDTLKIQSTSILFEYYKVSKEGLDFSGFIESMQILQVKPSSEEYLKAFCVGTSSKEVDVTSTIMNFTQMKKAWIKLIDVNKELLKRKCKVDRGLRAKFRNEERLYQLVTAAEETYLGNLSLMNGVIDELKQNKRKEKDEKRLKEEAFKERLTRAAARFIAERGQEKRLQLKKEQEERSKKRVEEKVMRNQLIARQEENRLKKQEELAMTIRKNEKLRSEQIRARGWDRYDLSKQNYRILPKEIYDNESSRERLSYVVHLDISKNILEELPESDFFYWCNSVKYINISHNRLQLLPNELTLCATCEILEAYQNRLIELPIEFGKCDSLIKLDLGNNFIQVLPNSIGRCRALKYLSMHSNSLTFLPPAIGACMKLEYVDLSNNKLTFIPDECQYCIALQHLNISSNQLLSLPTDIGKCIKLLYLDASCNSLSTLPNSFSELINLEYCDFHNNSINLSTQSFSKCTQLKWIRLHQNKITNIYKDISGCTNLVKLELQDNCIEHLSPEIGLLTQLQELNISRNKLPNLLVEIGACRQLTKLDVSENRLSGCLVESIALLSKLVELNISHNWLQALPLSIVGCQNLLQLNAGHNQLKSLPSAVFHLQSLQSLSFPSNLLTDFPLELSKLQHLTHLNLAENLFEYLPKQINVFTYLTCLDISKNQLKALPLEFIRILETVLECSFDGNPMTLFPPIWGRLWPSKHSTEGAENGYSISKVLDFMNNMNVFYTIAEEIWASKGHLYYAEVLTFDHFLKELKLRLTVNWGEELLESVKYLFFKAREKGVFPKWYRLEEKEVQLRQRNQNYDAARRDMNVKRSKAEYEADMQRRRLAYDVDVVRRAKRSEEMAAEYRVNETLFDGQRIEILRQDVKKENEGLDRVEERLGYARELDDEEEYLRLLRVMKLRGEESQHPNSQS